MNTTFPWVLSAKYLTAGMGSVMGILSAALASFAMRELRDTETENFPNTNYHQHRIGSNQSTKIEFRKQSTNDHNPIIAEPPSAYVNSSVFAKTPECPNELIVGGLNVVTAKKENGIIETSFA